MWALGYTILAFATLGLSPAVAVFILRINFEVQHRLDS